MFPIKYTLLELILKIHYPKLSKKNIMIKNTFDFLQNKYHRKYL